MCRDCGCGDSELVPVELQHRLLSENDRVAGHNRAHFLHSGTTAINLMGSPGSGKTALLEATAGLWTGPLAAVSGDLATDRDAARLVQKGITARSITTGSACHLDAALVHHALHDPELAEAVDASDFFFIENVGNLVCPAIYDLGQAANVVVLSVTEGEDKPIKYPVMFDRADLVVLTKVDLLPHLPGFSLDALLEGLAQVMPEPKVLLVSSIAGEGLAEWMLWLSETRTAVLRRRSSENGRGSEQRSEHTDEYGSRRGNAHEHDTGHRHEHAHSHTRPDSHTAVDSHNHPDRHTAAHSHAHPDDDTAANSHAHSQHLGDGSSDLRGPAGTTPEGDLFPSGSDRSRAKE